ncbi:hypothetical protein DSM106972_070600 [Dulcicalothrix desertica PCC 7102]|uniref:Uncharacterized protein n=1 Tax=Dulcicalothrix desertica PCC 7102 TaxID=232991 RepID=A0A433V4N3_9CYAN|nr:ATP-binding protein [Dulcicalothrix desertica]RUT01054.1 hypothetical protein DSM106972_070600 [Dulcicalothrix desertica PCC 7102]TWH39171.1 hypothetical protein CAL7102_08383 [Dulcicalothrix desertica PCC 7102]
MSQPSPAILFLTGASGVGKTTIVKTIQANNTNTDYAFFFSDAHGVASIDEMLEQAGSLKRYQELLTHKHVKYITDNYPNTSTVIFEGQARFNFIEDACNSFGVKQYSIILIDCAWKEMHLRLCNERKQPELANFSMRTWARFLRTQARATNIPIIDTSKVTLSEAVKIVQSYLSILIGAV